jgi:hypothetical protein
MCVFCACKTWNCGDTIRFMIQEGVSIYSGRYIIANMKMKV